SNGAAAPVVCQDRGKNVVKLMTEMLARMPSIPRDSGPPVRCEACLTKYPAVGSGIQKRSNTAPARGHTIKAHGRKRTAGRTCAATQLFQSKASQSLRSTRAVSTTKLTPANTKLP